MFTKAFKKGGVHPEESKYTAVSRITNANIPPLVKIPMAQHIGSPAKVVVEVGQKVEEGDLIGESSGFISANIHTSVPGIVKAIEKGNTLTSKNTDFVIIETGGEFKNWYQKKENYDLYSPAKLLEVVKKAGIVGLGGATFPTHVKLSPPPEKKVEQILINGAECEPYLTIDHRLMLEKTEEIIEGIHILMRILLVDKAYIGIEENKKDAIQKFRQVLKGSSDIIVAPLRTRYPQGGEKQLIEAITGKEVPSKGLPLDIGFLVENVATVYAVYEAVVYKKPLIDRGLTFTGEQVKGKGNYKVRIGTPIKQLLDDYQVKGEPGTIIAGGPMMGLEVNDLDLPVMKGTGGVVVLPKKRDYEPEDNPCVRCGKCVYGCPMGLSPTLLAKLCDTVKLEDAAENGLMDCIECGSCSYQCPSKIPIVGLIRFGKMMLKKKQQKQVKKEAK